MQLIVNCLVQFPNIYSNIFFRYMACVVFASVGVAIGILSMYVGSRMAELEQHRLYMERDGLPAVLTTKDGRVRYVML